MSGKLPSLKSLRVFESVARNLSFRKAADELCVTHSAVSHQIKLLEEELGVYLFHRQGRSIVLTEDGQMLYPVIHQSFVQIQDVVSRIKARNETQTLTIQTYATFGTKWLIPRLRHFQNLYPDIRVRLSISFVDVDFEKDDADVGILMGEQAWSHWHYEYLFNMDMFPVCSAHSYPSGVLPELNNLQDQQLIHLELAAEDWPLWLEQAGLPPETGQCGPVVDNYLQAFEMLDDGPYLAIAREAFVRKDLEQGRIVRPFSLTVPEPGSWYLVYPKQQHIKPEIELFNHWLQQQIRQDDALKILPEQHHDH